MVATTAPPGPLTRDSPDLLVPGAESEGRGRKRLTVLMLLDEMLEERDRQQPLIDEAEFRERVVMGEQWRGRDPAIERVLATIYDDETLITENLLYPLSLTWSARVNEGRVDPRAFPFQPTQDDVGAARASNRVLDYHKQKNNEDVLIAKAAMLAQYHGDVLFLPMWNPADGPRLVRQQQVDDNGPVYDIETQQPVYENTKWEWGGVSEEAVAAPDYWMSGEDEYTDAQWVCVRRVLDVHLTRQRLRAAGFPDARPKANEFPTAMDTSRRGVEAFEMWLKPGPRTKAGCFAIVIERIVVKCIPWPLKNKTRLPGAVWKIGHIRGQPRGKTHISDAIHQQRMVNRSLRSIIKRSEAAEAADLFAPSGIIDALKDNRFHRVRNDDDAGGAQGVATRTFWREGPEIPSSLFVAYNNARRALYDVFGISEATTTGGDPTQTNSGAQLQTATALDAQKIAPARRNLEECRKVVAQQILELWQQNVDKPTLVRVLGPDGALDADFFTGADLAGADVALEIRSGIYSSHLGQQVLAEEQGAAGQISQEESVERARTGLDSTVADTALNARVDNQAAAASRGQPQAPLPDVDPAKAAERLHIAIGAAVARGAQPPQLKALIMLAQAYLASAQQRALTQAGQGQPPAQQGQQQPGAPAQAGRPTPAGRNGPGRTGPSVQRGAMQATKIRSQQFQAEVPQ